MITLRFKPWREFHAFRDIRATAAFLLDTAAEAERIFRRGISSTKTGRVYRRSGGRLHQASKAGDWPARDSGELYQSISSRVTGITRMEIGTTKAYSIYLREGTSRMARRKMSDDALREALPVTRARSQTWVKWRHT